MRLEESNVALAPFFDKAALAAATVLRGFDRDAFASLLEAQLIEVAYDEQAAQSSEGRVALELVTNLLARLYPRISFTALAGASEPLMARLQAVAKSINPDIEFVIANRDVERTASVVVGATVLPDRMKPIIYAGSL